MKAAVGASRGGADGGAKGGPAAAAQACLPLPTLLLSGGDDGFVLWNIDVYQPLFVSWLAPPGLLPQGMPTVGGL